MEYDTPTAVKFITRTSSGTLIKVPGELVATKTRIEFTKSPFSLKDGIKAMRGARGHGYDDPPRKIWTVENTPRNWFQIQYMLGLNPYEWFEQDIVKHEYERPLMDHQKVLTDRALTYHFQIFAAEMGVGKTLSAIELMERSGVKKWIWVGPKSGLYAVAREFKKWKIADDIEMEVMTYEKLTSMMKTWTTGDKPPQGVIFDESSKVKNTKAQRTQAAQALADGIREEYGQDGYVILMSGTPAPRSPVDWHSQCEIAYPGFIREGNETAFKLRLGIYEKQENTITGQNFLSHVSWKDDEAKCDICGGYNPMCPPPGEDIKLCTGVEHRFTRSKNEVAYLFERMKGLTVVQHKKDCMDLPDKRYRIIECEPAPNLLRVAEAIVSSAPTTIQALIWLRELSDGFQYRNTVVGQKECPTCNGTKVHEYWVDPEDSERIFEMVDFMDSDYVKTLSKQLLTCLECEGSGEVDVVERTVKTVPCAKDDVLRNLLGESEDHGRVVVFAAFQASIDKLVSLCNKEGWRVVRVDGRGWNVYDTNGNQLDEVPLDYWADLDIDKVAFVANPKSGGMGLTLTEACVSIYFSNDHSSESRIQSEDRTHRPGMDMNRGATIVDLINLPSDRAVLDRLRSNRRLELMTLGEINEYFKT